MSIPVGPAGEFPDRPATPMDHLQASMEALASRVESLESTIKKGQYPFVQINDRREYDGYMVVTVNDDQRRAQNKIINDHIIDAGVQAIWEKTSVKVITVVVALATVGGFFLEIFRIIHPGP